MPLTNTGIKALKSEAKPRKHFDGGGLYLLVNPDGSKYWRLKYRFARKEKVFSIGVFQKAASNAVQVSLKEARESRDAAKRLLSQGIDPSSIKRVQKITRIEQTENSFEAVALEWFEKQKPQWVEGYAVRVRSRLERDLFPYIGATPIAEITPPILLSALRRVEGRGAVDTAHRIKQIAGQVLRYAVATGRAERDSSQDLKGAIAPPVTTHMAALTEPAEVGKFLITTDGYEGTPTVQAALKLAPLVFVRPGELRKAKWSEIDFDAAEWRFLVTKTKSKHIVPLSTQAIAILRNLYPITQRSDYVFPSATSAKRPMSDNAVLAAFRRLGIPKETMSGHGFRAMARTLLDEDWAFDQTS